MPPKCLRHAAQRLARATPRTGRQPRGLLPHEEEAEPLRVACERGHQSTIPVATQPTQRPMTLLRARPGRRSNHAVAGTRAAATGTAKASSRAPAKNDIDQLCTRCAGDCKAIHRGAISPTKGIATHPTPAMSDTSPTVKGRARYRSPESGAPLAWHQPDPCPHPSSVAAPNGLRISCEARDASRLESTSRAPSSLDARVRPWPYSTTPLLLDSGRATVQCRPHRVPRNEHHEVALPLSIR